MIRARSLLLLPSIASTLVLAPVTASAAPPVVAVFELETSGTSLTGQDLANLGEYLTAKLVETRAFQVVPKAQLEAALRQKKKESYAACYDQSCQIEIGKEVAAEQSLTTTLRKFGSRCLLSLTLYDLRTSTGLQGATAEGGCKADDILALMKEAVDKLAHPEMNNPRVKSPGSSQPAVAEPTGQDTLGAQADAAGPKGTAGAELVWLTSVPARVQMTKSEVTVAQYEGCVRSEACSAPGTGGECNWDKREERGEHPINCVDWRQADTFCLWAGGRLPTEAEWAAEGSNRRQRAHPWGEEPASCGRTVMSQEGMGAGCGRKTTWPVCAKPAGNSISGLCDMAGNVSEWTSTPKDGQWILCGAAWNIGFAPYFSGSATFVTDASRRIGSLGFRCARTAQ